MMATRRLLLLAPLGIAVAGGAGFYAMLRGMTAGTFDPRGVPSMLVGRRVPPFSLPGLPGSPSLSDADLATGTHPVVVNFFASWCVPCIEEVPALAMLRDAGVTLVGIAYKDQAAKTAAFLDRHGNPYTRLAADAPGQVAIDWGTTGVPETFVIDKAGIVRWHFAGPLTPAEVDGAILPLLKQYA